MVYVVVSYDLLISVTRANVTAAIATDVFSVCVFFDSVVFVLLSDFTLVLL
jgi:hypothetical protein